MSENTTRLTPLNIGGLLSACAYIFLTYRSQSYAQAGYVELWTISVFCAALCFCVFYYHHKNNIALSVKSLLFWALCFRLIGVAGFPIMEDDFYRYLWDGRMWVETGSPYQLAPADFFGDDTIPEKFEDILGRINYPDIATVYGPVCQWVFAISYWLAPGELWLLQLIFALLDFALVLLLLRVAPAKWVLLYAWCPLAIKEFAYSAHTDILGIFFMFAAIIARQSSRFMLAALLLSLSVGSKVFAIILVPLLLGFRWRAWLVFGAGILAITATFLSIDPWIPEGLGEMASHWMFNAPMYMLLLPVLLPGWIKLMMLSVFTAFWCVYAWRFIFGRENIIPRGDWLFGMFLLCIPVANAWYLMWLLPFAVIYPSRWAWVASISVLLSYTNGLNPDQPLPGAVVGLEYAAILLALFYDFVRPVRQTVTANKESRL